MAHSSLEPDRPAARPRLADLGHKVMLWLEIVGALGFVLTDVVRSVATGDVERSELTRNLHRMGVGSVPVIIVTALFVGGIMVVQAAPLIARYGAYGLLGWGASFGILREVGPVLTGLMISGRVGANNAAELGTMRVTEQVDGLRSLAIDPAGYLLAPRCIAIVTTTVLGTVFAMAIALLGASAAGFLLLGVHPMTFYNGMTGGGLLSHMDVLHGVTKSLLFGWIIALSSCALGLRAEGGAPGVGRAVNATVVVSALGIFIMDYLVSFAWSS